MRNLLNELIIIRPIFKKLILIILDLICLFAAYIIVSIITFVAIIIVLDTFKDPLSNIFPNLELVLYNLFETLRDLILFAKDLN